MKIKFDKDFREINITCKGLYNSNRANRDDLGSVLNELAIVYHEAAIHNEERGCFAVAKDYSRKSEQLTKICEELGIYED